jgi:hypothetical protein
MPSTRNKILFLFYKKNLLNKLNKKFFIVFSALVMCKALQIENSSSQHDCLTGYFAFRVAQLQN